LAIRKRQIDGHLENLTLNRDEPIRDEQTIRAMFEWDATANLTAALKLEIGQFDVNGRQIEIINDQPSTSDTASFNGRTYGQILDSTTIDVGPVNLVTVDADSSVLNNFQDFKRSSNGDYSYNDTHNVTLNLDYAWGEHTFTFITGLLGYETAELCDCDFTGASVFSVAAEEEYSQFSQEIRWVSPLGETFDFIAGAFYQQSSLDFFDSIRVASDILPQLINAADLSEGGARGERPPFDVEGGPTINGTPVIAGGVGDAGDEIVNLGTPRNFTADTKLFSGFVQATWNVTDLTRATLGLRYSYEEKEGSRKLEFSDISTGQIRDVGEVDTVVAKNFSAERHDLKGERSGGNVAPSLNIQHDWSNDVMLYATASIGYKSGGYDARSNASPEANVIRPLENSDTAPIILVGSFEYEEEQATSFEAGAKTTLLDGSAELNVAAFYTKYDDLQVSIFDGTLGFNVGNAGAATTMGIELDGRLALTENLMMTGALAFLDFEFTDFANGQCYQGQTPDTNVNGKPFCDYKGKTNQYVADYSGNLTFVYTSMVSKDIEFRGGADFVFTGAFNSSQNLDPSQEQDAYVKANLRFSLADVAMGWEAALLVKNATDETVVSYSNDTPLANSTFGSIGHYGFIDLPRTVALTATYRWY
jgi:iron complex outermembrane receptor protein